ncbi:hypothetical protein [Streptomyces sp. NPDC059080]|uniref:hypothetical protein n=1 Tax=Streptomyces sp. NPDC059080 TaxID=3346718 RepID=UPI0036B0DF19
MNIRSLSRGDGVVTGAAVLLFIASFLPLYSIGASDCVGKYCPAPSSGPNAWDALQLLMSVYLAGVIAAALIVLARALPQPPKVLGLELGQIGVVLSVFVAWTEFWWIVSGSGASAGMILGLIGALALAAGAVATPLVPALKAPLLGAPKPQTASPYGTGPQPGYGYPGTQQQPQPQGQGYGYPGGGQQQPDPAQQSYGGQQPDPAQQSYGGQQQPDPAQQSYGGQQPAPAGGTAGGAQGAAAPAEFAAFWFAVPVARPLYGEDGSPSPIAELAPGTWYLAVEQRGQALIAQTQDGRRGLLQDTTGIQRG